MAPPPEWLPRGTLLLTEFRPEVTHAPTGLMKKYFISLTLILACLAPLHLQAQGAAAEDPAHAELRALRTNVLAAITKGDVDSVLTHLHTNVVVTWQNADVCRGHPGVRDFFNRLGKQAFRGYKVAPTPYEMTILYGGDTGVVFGHSVGQYNLMGKDLEFNNRWTATVVKENGRWLLASYHVSLNALDNPLLNGARNALFWGASIASAIALFLGMLVGKKLGEVRAKQVK